MWRSTLCLSTDGLLGGTTEERIPLIARAGFDGFFTGWEGPEAARRCRALADELGLLYQSMHAPFGRCYKLWEPDGETEDVIRELFACLASCAENGIPLLVVHTIIGFDRHMPTAVGVENYRRVIREAQRLGVTVTLENTEGEEYLDALMEAFSGEKGVGFCLDTGHELCYNRGRDLLADYGDRLVATHINDNLGISAADGHTYWTDDLHLLPFDGIRDWPETARRLAACGYDGPLTFELCMGSKPGRHDNDKYARLPLEEYLAEAYARACRVAALVQGAL